MFGYRKPDDLPAIIPVFPLPGAVLFPRSILPLNIFEPRYLNMVDDALSSNRIIGMLQPNLDPDGEPLDSLEPIGCAGRITAFTETEDGRYLITLTGIARFRVGRELPLESPYRRVEADWRAFSHDLSDAHLEQAIDREALSRALRRFADARGVDVNWEAAAEAPSEFLVNIICAACPFDPPEKQALLEADTLSDRCDVLVALLELGAASPSGGGDSPLQ